MGLSQEIYIWNNNLGPLKALDQNDLARVVLWERKMWLYSLHRIYKHTHIYINVTSVSQSVQSLSRVRLFATPWIAARQASLSIANSWSLLRLMSIELVMPSSHLIRCCPLLLLPPIPLSIRVFSNESTLHMK